MKLFHLLGQLNHGNTSMVGNVIQYCSLLQHEVLARRDKTFTESYDT